MWEPIREIGYTAFLVRTDAPLFDPTGDGWRLQLYNLRRFPNKEWLEPVLGKEWWKAMSLPEVAATEFDLGQAARIRLLETEIDESRAALTRREAELEELRSELGRSLEDSVALGKSATENVSRWDSRMLASGKCWPAIVGRLQHRCERFRGSRGV